MAEERSPARVEPRTETGWVWLTQKEYEEWNVAASPDWVITRSDPLTDMVLIERVSFDNTQGEK